MSVEMYLSDMSFHKFLPDLQSNRYGHSCGSFGTQLVVAGGFLDRSFPVAETNTVEVLDLASGEGWKHLPNLPFRLRYAVMINVMGKLILVGGQILEDTGVQSISSYHNTSIMVNQKFERLENVGLSKPRFYYNAISLNVKDLCQD